MTDAEIRAGSKSPRDAQFTALLAGACLPTTRPAAASGADHVLPADLMRWAPQAGNHRQRGETPSCADLGQRTAASEPHSAAPAERGRRTRRPPETILFLASEPTDHGRILANHEFNAIKESLRVGAAGRRIKLAFQFAVRLSDLIGALSEHRPRILHFANHGTRDGGLVFEDDSGKAVQAPIQALAELISMFKGIECVVLNACYMQDLAEALIKQVRYVTGAKHQLSNPVAILFSRSFYGALGHGFPITDAYKFGSIEVKFANVSEDLVPRLHERHRGTPNVARRVALVAVEAEFTDDCDALEARLNGLARVERIDPGAVGTPEKADLATAAAIRAADVCVVLVGWQAVTSTAMRSALQHRAAFVAKSEAAPDDAMDADELVAAQQVRRRVERRVKDPAQTVAEVYSYVADVLHTLDPSAPGQGAALEPWEAQYLLERVPAWEQGRVGPLGLQPRGAAFDRARLYVSLRTRAQRWCYADAHNPVVVRARNVDVAEPEPGLADEVHADPFTEQVVSQPQLHALLLQGEPGSGKTVLLQHVAYVLALKHLGQDLPEHNLDFDSLAQGAPLLPIPVLVEARSIASAVAGVDGSLIAAIRSAFNQVAPVTTEQVGAGLRAGRYLVLIDALDEVSTTAGRQHVLQRVAGLVASGAKSRVIVATRPTAQTGAPPPRDLAVLPLAPIDQEGLDALVERWCAALHSTESEKLAVQRAIKGVRERHEQDGRDNPFRNPLLLTCLLLVHEQGRRLPDAIAELYERMVAVLLDLRDSDYTANERKEALKLIFHGMQRRGMIELSVAEIAEDLMKWRPRNLPDAFAAEAFLDRLANDTGLLRFDDRREPGGALVRLARAWHRSFQGFLAAGFLAAQSDSVAQVTDSLFKSVDGRPPVIEDPFWEEALTLLVGAYSSGDRARAYVEHLVKRAGDASADSGLTREGRVLGLAATGLVEYPQYFQGSSLPNVVRDALTAAFSARGGSWPRQDRLLALRALGRLGDRRLTFTRYAPVAPGRFRMGGDPRALQAAPAHEVIVNGFMAGRWPVTVAEYAEFIDAGDYTDERWWDGQPAWVEPEDWRHGQLRFPNRPVVNVSWYEARAWCRWFSEHHAPEGLRVILPSEEQWEYLARGGDGRVYPWGDDEPGAEDVARANYLWGAEPGDVAPVGAFPAGHRADVWDLAGNVWEWTSSRWRDARDPTAWPSEDGRDQISHDRQRADERRADDDDDVGDNRQGATQRVVRGGSWQDQARMLRCACRLGDKPAARRPSIGFRPICVPRV